MSSHQQQWRVTEPYIDLHCQLGEGPYYEKASNSLRFVDIKKKQLHSVSLDDGPASLTTVQLDVPVTVTADIERYDPRDRILIGAKYGIAELDRKTGKYEYVTRFAKDGEADNQRLRSNDGAVDPHGRFWLGTMTDFGLGPFKPEGKRLQAGCRGLESWQRRIPAADFKAFGVQGGVSSFPCNSSAS